MSSYVSNVSDSVWHLDTVLELDTVAIVVGT